MGLQFDRACRKDRGLAIDVIFEDGVVYDDRAIEFHGHAFTDHGDLKFVPFAKGAVHFLQWIFAGPTWGIIPEAAGSFVSPNVEFFCFGSVPDLHLGAAAQVNAAVGFGYGLVFEMKFKVAIVFLGGEEKTVAVIHEFIAIDGPMRGHVCHGIGMNFCELFWSGLEQRTRVFASITKPAAQVLAVKGGLKAGGRGGGSLK